MDGWDNLHEGGKEGEGGREVFLLPGTYAPDKHFCSLLRPQSDRLQTKRTAAAAAAAAGFNQCDIKSINLIFNQCDI